jgi:hypothetical protein
MEARHALLFKSSAHLAHVDALPSQLLHHPSRVRDTRVDGTADVVKSARSAVPVFRPARFSGPFPAPGVPLSGHRALPKSRS